MSINRSKSVPEKHSPGWLDTLDHRTALARDLQARYQEICSDLGGADTLSYAQRSLIERALWLEYWLARQERELASDADFDVSRWIQAANSLQGLFAKLGLERRAREVPDLNDYLKRKATA